MKRAAFVIEREGHKYLAQCPEFDVASQGESEEDARRKLQEAVELFLETAGPQEIKIRQQSDLPLSKFKN